MLPESQALIVTFAANVSMVIGAVGAWAVKPTDRKVLSCTLGVSTGVMVFVSLHSILHESTESFDKVSSVGRGGLLLALTFFLFGLLAMSALDAFVHLLLHRAKGHHDAKTAEASLSQSLQVINLPSENDIWMTTSTAAINEPAHHDDVHGVPTGMDVASIVTVCAIVT
jgi:zinc transporter ZupT